MPRGSLSDFDEPHYLSDADFQSVIANAPLFSLDLVIVHNNRVLLGQRVGRPARGFWFVPGGRIRKSERLGDAFRRISLVELGVYRANVFGKILGVFEHFYNDCVFGDDYTTHYIAMGVMLDLDLCTVDLPLEQHDKYAWWKIADAVVSQDVHEYTRKYLKYLSEDKLAPLRTIFEGLS